MKQLDINTLLSLSPMELLLKLEEEFTVEIPTTIHDVQGMDNASKILLKLTGYYSFLSALQVRAEVLTREYKRERSKGEYEDMIDRKKVITAITDMVKQQYVAVSRAVTIHIENNKELKMTEY